MLFDFLRGAVHWVRAKFQFEVNGAPVPPKIQKGAAEVVVQNARIEMAKAAESLSDRANVGQWYAAMKAHVKNAHIANAALARGGWEQMRPADYRRLQNVIAPHFMGDGKRIKGLRAFAEDVARGRYGDVPSDNAQFLRRAQMYSTAARATYENERLLAQRDALGGDTESQRLLAGVAHCDDCLNWAALGWIDTELMYSEYPIAASICGGECHCVIITRRKGST